MTEGVDYSGTANADWNGLASTLAANGKRIAGRYAVNDKSPSGRGITGPEYTALMAHGVDVFLYYEEDEAWMLGGFSAGVRAANAALANIAAAGMPSGMAVYYSHDIDPQPSHFAAIDACLNGAASVAGIARVGFYGGWLGIDHVAAAGTARWFVQTTAWEYGRGLHPAAHLYQYAYDAVYYGTPCDLVRSVKTLYGGAAENLTPGTTTPPPTTTTTTTPPPVPRPANAGRYLLSPTCYLSDHAAGIGEEITDVVIGGEVTIDVGAEVPTTFAARLLDPGRVPAFGWVRPFLTMTWYDQDAGKEVSQTEPVGCFQVMPPGERHTAAMATGLLDGRDACWKLKQAGLPNPLTYQIGDNVVDAVVGLVQGAGFSKVRIPAKSNAFRTKHHYESGTPRLDVINDLLMRIGYYPLWFDRHGVATSRRIQPRSKVQPRRTIDSAAGDVVGVVDIQTDADKLCNRATCVVNDPRFPDPVTVTKSNTRADSPASIGNLGFVKAITVEGQNIDTVAEATDLVNQALEDGASVQRRVTLATLPDPAFAFHETLRLAVARDDGTDVLVGTWWWDQLRIGFTPAQQPMTWRLNKLVPWDG